MSTARKTRADRITEALAGRKCDPRAVELAREVQSAQPEGAPLHPEAALFLAQGLG